jgi:hypothetical protein
LALPVGTGRGKRGMADTNLSGNLRTTVLADVLRRLAIDHKTGVLHLERSPIETRIIFREGRIFSSWSNDPREALGKFLVRDGVVTAEQLFEAQVRQVQEGRLVGAILLADGLLSEERLQAVLVTKAEETIYDLFLWPEGRFYFNEGEFPKDIHIHVDMNVGDVLLEGARRVHEWVRIRKFFPHLLRTRFRVTGEPGEDHGPRERRALSLAAAGKSLAAICVEMHWTEFEAAVRFLELHAREIVALGPPAPERDERIMLDQVPVLLARAYGQLHDGELDDAAGIYESILTLDPLNLHAKKGLRAVLEARSRDFSPRGSAIDPERSADHVTLVVTGGPSHGTVHVVPDAPSQTILGSGPDSHLRISLPNVDRYHARIAAYSRGIILSDAGSITGTFANGRPVEGSHRLAHGDQIGLGPPGSPDSAAILVQFPPHLRAALDAAREADANRSTRGRDRRARPGEERFR